MGLTYTNWQEPFKSSVTLRFAQPFAVDPVDTNDRAALRTARKQITHQLARQMEKHTVQIPEAHRDLVGKIAQFYSVNRRSDFDRLKSVARYVEQLVDRFADERSEFEQKLDEYLELSDQLKIYPGEERVKRSGPLLLLSAVPALVGYVLHAPILWMTRAMVPRRTTALHSLGDKRVTWGIAFTFVWYLLIAIVAFTFGLTNFGLWGIPIAIGVVVLIAGCGLVASRTFRHVNMFLRSVLPSGRSFKALP